MKSIKLTLGAMALIHAEIFGNPSIGVGGLAKIELPIGLKFKLHTLAKNLEQHVQFFQEENRRLVALYGTTDDSGNTTIDTASEGYSKFMEEMNVVAIIEHDIKVPSLSIEEFYDIKSTDYPAYLFELIGQMSE
jgi:hypothetical protein